MFNTKKCTLFESSWSHLAIGTLYAPGCSDEGAIMIMSSTVRMIINEIKAPTNINIPISNLGIAGGLPSRATLSSDESNVAAMCLMRTSMQLVQHGVPAICGQADHRNRKRIHHCPKTIHAAIPMTVLTYEVDFEVVLQNPFVQENWDQIRLLASQDIWTEGAFKKLRISVIRNILIHPIHQQLSERMVQAAALAAQTNVNEDRRTCRAIAMTTIVRPSNQAALLERQATLEKQGKKKIDRAQGMYRVASQLTFIDQFFADVEQSRELFGQEELDRIKKDLSSSKAKQSELDRAEMMQLFDDGLELERNRNKAEQPRRMDITAFMGGGILLRILTKKNGTEDVVNAEIKARNIAMSDRQQESWNIAAKRTKLRKDEMKRMADNSGMALNGIRLSDVTYIKPISDDMKGLFPLQESILSKEEGNEEEEEC